MYGRSSLKIRGRLSYARIVEELGQKSEVFIAEGRSKNYALRTQNYMHPVLGEYERAMCMRLYDTDILRYFHDGTIVVNDWDSNITRSCTSDHGPFPVSIKEGQQQFRDMYGQWWPMRDSIVVRPDGTVQNTIKVRKQRIKPELKSERRQISKHFRDACYTRLVLGEFPQLIEATHGGYYAKAPENETSRQELFAALNAQADHIEIVAAARGATLLGPVVFGQREEHQATKHESVLSATEALINCLLRTALSDWKWYEDVSTEHCDIRVRAA